jgi:chromate transporter
VPASGRPQSPELRNARPDLVPFGEALRVWLRVAALSFGGPAGQIAVMHRIVVDEKRWIGEARFLHALSYCTLLPGPEAQQLAIYIGWLMNGTAGGIAAGSLFVLPGFVSIMALSWVYAIWGQVSAVAAMFFGLKAAVLAIVLQAVVRVGSRALRNRVMVGIAAAAFLGIFFLGVPFPVIVLGAGLFGWAGTRLGSTAFQVGGGPGNAAANALAERDSVLGEELPAHARATVATARRAASVWLLLWLLPVAAILLTAGPDSTFGRIAVFFTEMAVVTFGGAYAALAYVAQEAVVQYHWLRPGEMLDGLGMAETTPGPLIIVTQFVGFMAAFREPGALHPLLAGTLGGALTTWVTFTPCFLWIFLGAPYIERLRGNQALSGALAAITAAIVGVILNLAAWFALHTWFRESRPLGWFDAPVLASVDPWALGLSTAAILAVFRFKAGMIATLLTCAGVGVLLHLAGAL